MAEGKWIGELTASTPLEEAALRVLTVRLQVVHDYLPLALNQWKDDPEHVHQLRVGTRRGGAALAIFADCLPTKTHTKVRKHLRRLRRAAGEARDWDVFSAALVEREAQATPSQRPGFEFLIGYASGQRVAAQRALEEAGVDAPFDFARRIGETLAAVRAPTEGPQELGSLAESWVAAIVQDLRAAASDNLDQYEHLHQVRILGKRLRYGMEIFAGCFEPAFKTRDYPMIESMQEILGHANDSHVASQRLSMLRDWLRVARAAEWKRYRAGIESLLRYHQKRLPEQRKLFMAWWGKWQKSPLHKQCAGSLV